MPDAPEDHPQQEQQPTLTTEQVQDAEARMNAHLAAYTRALHDYTLALWTESRRVAQEREKFMRERHATMLNSAGLPTTNRQSVSTPVHQQQNATRAAGPNEPIPEPTQSGADDLTPKAVVPPKSNPVDNIKTTRNPPPAPSS